MRFEPAAIARSISSSLSSCREKARFVLQPVTGGDFDHFDACVHGDYISVLAARCEPPIPTSVTAVGHVRKESDGIPHEEPVEGRIHMIRRFILKVGHRQPLLPESVRHGPLQLHRKDSVLACTQTP